MSDDASWFFTYGPDHVLLDGRVTVDQREEKPGLPLSGFYVLIPAPNDGTATARLLEVFGPEYSSMYPERGGPQAMERMELLPLLSPPASAAIGQIPVCRCGEYSFTHCAGAHRAGEKNA
jgi:hypothetical protein